MFGVSRRFVSRPLPSGSMSVWRCCATWQRMTALLEERNYGFDERSRFSAKDVYFATDLFDAFPHSANSDSRTRSEHSVVRRKADAFRGICRRLRGQNRHTLADTHSRSSPVPRTRDTINSCALAKQQGSQICHAERSEGPMEFAGGRRKMHRFFVSLTMTRNS